MLVYLVKSKGSGELWSIFTNMTSAKYEVSYLKQKLMLNCFIQPFNVDVSTKDWMEKLSKSTKEKVQEIEKESITESTTDCNTECTKDCKQKECPNKEDQEHVNI